MCGIAGFVRSAGTQPGDERLLRAMCDAIAHRGPDDDGRQLIGAAALGMRRLSIIDVAGGHQPIHNETGDVSVVFTSAMVAAPMAFSTLNGDVDVTLPASLKANVRLRSDNGEIYSDFDIAMDQVKPDIEEQREGGKYRLVVSREMTGRIQGGGPELFLKTFNGDILLRRKN